MLSLQKPPVLTVLHFNVTVKCCCATVRANNFGGHKSTFDCSRACHKDDAHSKGPQ